MTRYRGSRRDHHQGIHPCAPQRERGSVPQATGSGTQMTTKVETQFQCRHLQEILVELPQNSLVGQQRQQISELQFNKFPDPQSFLLWKIRFKNQVTTCSEFPSEAMLWIKEVEMVDSFEELKSSRTVIGHIFSLLRCWT